MCASFLFPLLWDPSSLLLGGLVLLGLLWWLSTRRPPGLPPGPGPALPLLGHLHLLAKDPRPQLSAWRRQYGDVISLYLGPKLMVVVAGYPALRHALVTLADDFADRPDLIFTEVIAKYKGISASSGSKMKEQRAISLKILRDMGMGTNVLAHRIHEEITHYLEAIRRHQGAPTELVQMTQVSVSNIIGSMIWGRRSEYDDPEFVDCLRRIDHVMRLLSVMAIANVLPVLGRVPGDLFKVQEVKSNFDHLLGFVDQHIAEHRRTLEEEETDYTVGKGENTDFIYSYLRRIREHESRGNTETTTLDVENLKMCLLDLFFGGTETTANAVQWALLFFLHHPDVQERCFRDILEVVGPHRRPVMSDRPRLPYLEATIMEVLRKGDLTPLSLLHCTARDVNFRGYVIPKGTIVLPFLSSVLQDPDVWGDPENFRPERFLGPDGKLMSREEWIPFGLGRRQCLGESLARMELFLYLSALIQNFHFLSPEDGQLPPLQGILGAIHTPQPYKIRAVPRF